MSSRTLEIVVNQSGSAKAGIEAQTAALGKMDSAAKKASVGVKDLFQEVTGIELTPLKLAAGGLLAVGAATIASINAAREGRAVQAQLAAVLESTGHAAGVSQEELNKHAEALQNVTNYDDEAVGSAQALLLTFTKIGRDVMPQATKTVLDMSVALGQDTKSSAIQLGKALNDPINGVTALRRVGVSFTESQREMISTLVKSGDILGAQNIILQELQTEFGGSAEAARVADGGFIALGNSVGNLTESVGELILSANEGIGVIGGLISVVDGMTESVNQVSGAFNEGLLPGLAQIFDNANPVLQVLEKLGVDVIPDFVASSSEATGAVNTQAQAHLDAAGAAVEQASAIGDLNLSQVDALSELSRLEEDYNEKKQDLLQKRLDAESDASTTQAENYQAMQEKLSEIDLNRGKQTDEQIAAKKQKVIDGYNQENIEIKAKLDERQKAIDDQIAKEKAQHEEKAAEIKRLMALQVLEQSGQLEELTGIAGITAQQYMDAVAAGAISANKEVETQAAQTEKTFEGAQKRTADIVRQNQALIAKLHGETSSSITQTSSRTTSAVVSDFERQANAAYKANMAMRGSSSYTSTRRNTDFGAGFAQGGAFKVPPGYPNDTFPMRVSSGELVTVIPASQAGMGPGFAKGTSGIPAGFKPDGKGDYVHNSYQPGYVWNGSRYVPPKSSSFSGVKTQSAATTAAWAAYNSRKVKPIAAHLRSGGGSSPSLSSMASASPISGPVSSGGGMSGSVVINLTYAPAVSLGTAAELEQALDTAWMNLARKHGVQTVG